MWAANAKTSEIRDPDKGGLGHRETDAVPGLAPAGEGNEPAEIGEDDAGAHFGLAEFAVAESDGDFANPEGITAANQNLEGDLEAGCVGRDAGQKLASHGEEPGEGVVDVGQGPRAGGGGTGHEAALAGPAGRAAAGRVAAADDHIAVAVEYGEDELGDFFRGMRAVGVYDKDDAGAGGACTGEDGAGEAVLGLVAGEEFYGLRLTETADDGLGLVAGAVIDDNDLHVEGGATSEDFSDNALDVLRLIQGRNDDRDARRYRPHAGRESI